MRVWFVHDENYVEYPNADHWEQCGSDWVELCDENDNLIAILNWKHVNRIEMIG